MKLPIRKYGIANYQEQESFVRCRVFQTSDQIVSHEPLYIILLLAILHAQVS